MKITAFALVALLHVTTLSAQDQPSLNDYQVLLVPVFFFGPGAHGSQWETSVSLATTATERASMPVPLLTDTADFCGIPEAEIFPNKVLSICSGFASPTGLLLYLPKTLDLKDLHVNARVRDLTRAASSAGTEIPVVPERDFSSRELLLLDIPSDARFRSNLRIYGGTMIFSPEQRFIHPGGGSITVQIYDSRDLHLPLVTTEVAVSAPQAIPGSPYLVFPGSFSIGDLVAAFPQLANVPSYTIRIQTAQPDVSPVVEMTIWAFVTITNNETQEVTTVSP